MLVTDDEVNKQNFQWDSIPSQPFDENTYILRQSDGLECVIVDPGFEPVKIQQRVESANLVPSAILNTHGHSDHIAGNAAMKNRWPDCPLIIGTRDAEKLTDPFQNLSAQYGVQLVSPPADRTVNDSETLTLAGIDFHVWDTPGHSLGHVVFLIQQGTPWVLVAGDVLFQGSIGRTDFPDGSFEDLVKSIHTKLFTLPEDTIVLPGHGPPTTIGEEMRSNSFVGIPAGYRPS